MDQSQPCIVRFTNLKCAQHQWTEEIDLEMEKSEKTHEKHKRNYNGIYRTAVYRANNTCTIKCIRGTGRKRIRTGNWTKRKTMENRKSYNIRRIAKSEWRWKIGSNKYHYYPENKVKLEHTKFLFCSVVSVFEGSYQNVKNARTCLFNIEIFLFAGKLKIIRIFQIRLMILIIYFFHMHKISILFFHFPIHNYNSIGPPNVCRIIRWDIECKTSHCVTIKRINWSPISWIFGIWYSQIVHYIRMS